MILSLVNLASNVLGKNFLFIESFRYIPDELVEKIFDEYLKTIADLSIINENDLLRIVNLLTDYHADIFCTSFCYYQNNYLNILTDYFYLQLFKRIQNTIIQLDFSHIFEKFDYETKGKFLNLIGQMKTIEYLRLTFNQFDDDDIRLLTASNRIQNQTLCNLHTLHLQGNHLTSRSARFLKALTSLNTLYISPFASSYDKSIFIKELEILRECTCSIQHSWEEIINRGWISKILQLQSTTITDDNHFYRKRRRINHEESNSLIKLVRFCSICHSTVSLKSTKQTEKILSQSKAFIDSTQANDLLAYYL